MTVFYLGCSQPHWLEVEPSTAATAVPLFIPAHRLQTYLYNEKWPRPRCRWALDSGGFNHLRKHGLWRFDAETYANRVWSYDRYIGNLDWAAPMDWMCEDDVLAATGLTVLEHQQRTVANYVELVGWWWRLEDWWRGSQWDEDEFASATRDPEFCPFMPVLQGDTESAYLRCADMYEAAGVHLPDHPLVGLGSVCRREATSEIVRIIERIKGEVDVDLHGFGVKTGGIAAYGDLLASADSQAWSLGARWRGGMCQHGKGIRWERNCRDYAVAWWTRVVSGLDRPRARQLRLFEVA